MASPASSTFYQSAVWLRLREACFHRDGRRCVVPGCGAPATHCDHIKRRPYSKWATSFDVLENLRSLCATHDNQVKEAADGSRKSGGTFRVIGADAAGWPLDPKRRR